MNKGATRRRTRAAVAGVLLLGSIAAGCATADPEVAEPGTTVVPPGTSLQLGSGLDSNRRVFDDCDPQEAAGRHQDFVGERVLIQWAWQEMGEESAALQVPATVLRVDPPVVAVTFDPTVPNLELFSSVWLYSGHIAALPDGSFAVAPCSATLTRDER